MSCVCVCVGAVGQETCANSKRSYPTGKADVSSRKGLGKAPCKERSACIFDLGFS